MSLLLLLLLTGVQTQVQVQVSLGQSQVLNCSVEAEKTFWFMKVHSGLQVCISRNVADNEIDFYTWGKSKKFSVEGNKLKINNITEKDLRLYSCARKKNTTTKKKEQTYDFQEAFDVRDSYKLIGE